MSIYNTVDKCMCQCDSMSKAHMCLQKMNTILSPANKIIVSNNRLSRVLGTFSLENEHEAEYLCTCMIYLCQYSSHGPLHLGNQTCFLSITVQTAHGIHAALSAHNCYSLPR